MADASKPASAEDWAELDAIMRKNWEIAMEHHRLMDIWIASLEGEEYIVEAQVTENDLKILTKLTMEGEE